MKHMKSLAALAAVSGALLASCANPSPVGQAPTTQAKPGTVSVAATLLPLNARKLMASYASTCDIPASGGWDLDDIATLTFHVDFGNGPDAPPPRALEYGVLGAGEVVTASSTFILRDLPASQVVSVWVEAVSSDGSEITDAALSDPAVVTQFNTFRAFVAPDIQHPLMIAKQFTIKFAERPIVGKWKVIGLAGDANSAALNFEINDITSGGNLDPNCLQVSQTRDVEATSASVIFGNLLVGHEYEVTVSEGASPTFANEATATFVLDPEMYSTDKDYGTTRIALPSQP